MIITSIFIFIAALSKSICDTLADHYSTSIFQRFSFRFWDKNMSWKNKYKDETPYQEKFLGSTTFFVWLTDGWHLFDFIRIISYILAIVFYSEMASILVDFFVLISIHQIIFELFYSFILRIKR